MNGTVIVDKDIIAKVRNADIEHGSYVDIMNNLINSHLGDTDDSILTSPVFLGLKAKLQESSIAFETAKQEMIDSVFNAEQKSKITQWSCDYNSCIITYNM